MEIESLPCNKNNRVYRTLLDAVRGGTLAPGARLPGERELAVQYECSRITIRRALEKLEANRIVRRLQGDGTYVNSRQFHPDSDFRIGLVLDCPEDELYNDPWIAELLSGMLSAGCRFVFALNVVPARHGESIIAALERRGQAFSDYDGFIVARELTHYDIEMLNAGGCLYVAFLHSESQFSVSSVQIDHRQGGYLAAAHLLSIGCRHPFYMGPVKSSALHLSQREGFRQALREYGLPDDPQLFDLELGDDEYADAERLIDELVRKKIPFDGFLTGTDGSTYSTVIALRKHGFRVPEDVSVIMWDDFPWVSKALRLPLTVVRQPFQAQVVSAIEILMAQRNQKNTANIQKIMQPSLVVRCSCRTPGMPVK